jgi:hypothetical protein
LLLQSRMLQLLLLLLLLLLCMLPLVPECRIGCCCCCWLYGGTATRSTPQGRLCDSGAAPI